MIKAELEIEIAQPTEYEMEIVRQLTKDFELDGEEFKMGQFIIAKSNNRVLGFGREKKHQDCTEISTIGVVQAYRNQGIGKSIVTELIKKIKSDTIFIVTVIPDYFCQIGFKTTSELPESLKSKIEFCASFCNSNSVNIMKLIKSTL
ncbi:MAG: GNAT family N-acetyltransferase [Bacteroidetes bacterium]|nr:GNAT family N-acetyltransferase [Bacteroidota bacterium]